MMAKEKLKISIPDRGDKPECPEEVSEPLQSSMLNDAPDHTGVGSRLREARLDSKRSLKQVVSALKIRLVYIQAIEEERYSDLPGSAYGLGFVRSYAEYLGLDHDQIVRDFRAETANYNRPTDLHFPEPEAKSQTPPVAVAVVSLLVAATLYMSWDQWPDFWQNQFSKFDQSIIPVPPFSDSQPSEVSPDAVVQMETTLKNNDLPDRDEVGSENQNIFTTVPDQAGPEVLETMPDQDIGSRPGLSSSLDDGIPGGHNATEDRTTEENDLQGVGPQGLILPEGSDLYWNSSQGRFMPRSSLDITATDPGRNMSTDADRIEEEPKIYGELDADVRIVIEATQDSWVQIRDPDGTLLLTRVLLPGERFRVPDRPGLSLTTGNAGGIRILVDGNSAPPIGPEGAVRRDVLLEPEDLLYPGVVAVSDGDEHQEAVPFP